MTETTQTSVARETERGIRYAILAIFIVGFRRRNVGAVVNAVVAIAATYLPDVVEAHYDVEFLPWQRAYTATAMFTHAAGMLGPSEEIGWWDHLTHIHSATLLGGLVHVAARRRERDSRPRVLAAVVCLGVLWELMEYTIRAVATRLSLEPVLITYGEKDTFFDLCFDVLGAFLVLAFGDRLLRNFRRSD